MSDKPTITFIDTLIFKTKAMTKEEFAAREKELGVDQIDFNPADYEEKTDEDAHPV